ncbi:MAG: CotH kinase family protein [Bacteroidota bacterium]
MKRESALCCGSLILILLLFRSMSGFGQVVGFESSNLPIIVIDTDGRVIPDEPKIAAHMGIIRNDPERNQLTDPLNQYDGYIGIELRGNSSQNWPKKPYTIETRDSAGANNNVSLFGMPSENDWVLHAPYVDKTLMRNVLMYSLAGEFGRYAPRTQFCELILNGEYMGVYVLVEKIKKDRGRVDISAPVDGNLTGGYLLEMVVNNELKEGETHFRMSYSGKEMVVKYPKPEDITADQLTWISDYVNGFEGHLNNNMWDRVLQYIDLPSFIDQMLLSEGFNQYDAYVKSQYFYKDVNGKLFSGPGWDYNRCIGNAKYYTSWMPDVWWLREPQSSDPESWYRINWPALLMDEPLFMSAYCSRWTELRKSTFSLEHIYSLIDGWVSLLEEARERNFERWPVLGVSINNKYAFPTYMEEIDYMKDWIHSKFTWLDEQFLLSGQCPKEDTTTTLNALETRLDGPEAFAFPNPFATTTTLSFHTCQAGQVSVVLYDYTGREVETVASGWYPQGRHSVRLDGSGLPGGSYLFIVHEGHQVQTGKIVLIK